MRKNVRFLAKASKILSSSLDYNATLASVANLVVSKIADFCIIDLLKDGGIDRVIVKARGRKQNLLAQEMYKFPPDPANKNAIFDTAKRSKPILIKKATERWLNKVSKIPGEREIIKKLKLNSHIFVPLKSRNRVIGVLTIASNNKKFSYSEEHVLLAEELAGRAGVAVDNSRLYLEAQEAILARDEFLSIASHELKTPLTTILLQLQSVLENINKKSNRENIQLPITQMLESAEKQSKKLARLINDLLNISLASTGRLVLEKEKVNPAILIQDVIDRFKVQLEKEKYEIKTKLDSSISVFWDPVRIEQVITNLLSNAIKYGRKKPIEITLKKQKDTAIISIKDKGIGIDQNDQDKIFELFSRGSKSQEVKGLGVGLYITKHIVEAHGGRINLVSKPGKGSEFIVELPIRKSIKQNIILHRK